MNCKKSWKKNTWNIRHLVDNSFVPSSKQPSIFNCRLTDLKCCNHLIFSLGTKEILWVHKSDFFKTLHFIIKWLHFLASNSCGPPKSEVVLWWSQVKGKRISQNWFCYWAAVLLGVGLTLVYVREKSSFFLYS